MQLLLLRVFSLFPNGPLLSVSFELVSGGGINAAAAASLFPFSKWCAAVCLF